MIISLTRIGLSHGENGSSMFNIYDHLRIFSFKSARFRRFPFIRTPALTHSHSQRRGKKSLEPQEV